MADELPAGHHFRWDLDKTYLRTEFDTIKDLVRTFRQRPEEKETVPGAARLLRELLDSRRPESPRYVTFISGSPRQMRRVLTEKLRLDGIEPTDVILKPNLANLLRLRFRALRGQVGYKLGALLASRITGVKVAETLFGDDAEMDAFIYSLYADILADRVDEETVREVLEAVRVYSRERDRILAQLTSIRGEGGGEGPGDTDVVGRIFIHLDRRSPPGSFATYGRRVVPIFNYFQAALLLNADGILADDALLRVLASMGEGGYNPTSLANSLQDLMRRGFARPEMVRHLEQVMADADAIVGQPADRFAASFRRAVAGIERVERGGPPEQPPIDYVLLAYGKRYRPARQLVPRLPWLS